MSCIPARTIRIKTIAYSAMLGLLAVPILGFAQDPYGPPPSSPGPSPGWRQFSNPPANSQPSQPNQPVPSRVTLQAGTFVTVRVDQMLSSDRNQAGDAFSATLTRPVIADGVVVAQPGQLVGGRVAEVQKAGRVTGVSRLAVQLTDLALVDGQQLPIATQLARLTGPRSRGQDAGTIVGSGATGAAVGAAADLGVGAAIGAGAGAIAGTVGVLLTRGHPSVIYPESELTFRLENPVTISTERAPQAFRFVDMNDYNGEPMAQGAQGPPPRTGWNCLGYGWPPPPAVAPPYAYSPYPYYWGPSFTFWYGGYGPRYFYGRGYYGRASYGRAGYRR